MATNDFKIFTQATFIDAVKIQPLALRKDVSDERYVCSRGITYM